jgi:serine/threonine protein phosphatase 1
VARLFAISDIHGCYRPFYELVVNVIDLKKDDRLILLGDYIDRGDQSKEVIDFIIDLKKNGFDVTPLTGNHEQMMLESFHDSDMLPLWFLNNGMTTLESFGIQDVRDIGFEYIKFLAELEYFHEAGNMLFVHAGFNDHNPDPFTDRHIMIWECRYSYQNPVLAGKTIIHGHRPKTMDYVKKLITEKSRVIPIDTGCIYEKEMGYGNLSALEVNSMTLISVTNK